MNDTHDYMVDRIISAMKDMDESEAVDLASEITFVINAELYAQHHTGNSCAVSNKSTLRLTAERLMPKPLRVLSFIGIGWEAYRLVFCPLSASALSATDVEFVYSMPLTMADIMAAEKNSDYKLSPGSLMRAVYGLINKARRDIFIASPYWSYQGVEKIKKHITKSSMRGVSVVIVTQSYCDLKQDERDAVSLLSNRLKDLGAEVSVLSPIQSDSSVRLFIHAKTIIIDDGEAYIGSANFTRSGFDSNFEIGVTVSGHSISRLAAWKKVVISCCEPFCQIG